MKEQDSIPTSKTERSAKFVKTGFKVGGNYIKHYSKKLFNPSLTKDELNLDNATDIYTSLSEINKPQTQTLPIIITTEETSKTIY